MQIAIDSIGVSVAGDVDDAGFADDFESAEPFGVDEVVGKKLRPQLDLMKTSVGNRRKLLVDHARTRIRTEATLKKLRRRTGVYLLGFSLESYTSLLILFPLSQLRLIKLFESINLMSSFQDIACLKKFAPLEWLLPITKAQYQSPNSQLID